MNGNYNVGDVVFDKWTLVGELGEGSYGKVFEAERKDYGTYKAAIKVITIPRTQNELAEARANCRTVESVKAYFKDAVDEITKEFALMDQLHGETNIVDYLDHRVIEHTNDVGWDILIRMELLTPLIKRIESDVLPGDEVVKLGIDICKALELCQKTGIMHRDVKPANIFISDHGNYKLGDFGIAKRVSDSTDGGGKKGTPAYMAPEIYHMETYDLRADICSLGLVMYRLLNENREAFLPLPPSVITYSDQINAIGKRMKGDKLPAPKSADEELASIVLKACAYKPEDRYETPQQMRKALEGYLKYPIKDNASVSQADNPAPVTQADVPTPVTPVDNPAPAIPADNSAPVTQADNPAPVIPVDNPASTFTASVPPTDVPASVSPLRKKHSALWAAALVAVVAIILIAKFAKKDYAKTADHEPLKSDDGLEVEISADPVWEPSWSEWLDHLPEGIGSDYMIEAKLQYRSAPLQRVEDYGEVPEGMKLVESYSCYSDWSEPGEWQSGYIENDLTALVEERPAQYTEWGDWSPITTEWRPETDCRRRTTLYDHGIKSYIYQERTRIKSARYRYKTRQRYDYYYSDDTWSDYSDMPIKQNENIVVNYRMQYRYAEAEKSMQLTPSMKNYPTFSGDYTSYFHDVDDNAWYGANKSSILQTVNELNILLPDSYMLFHPDETIRVGQVIRAAVIINRIYNGYSGLICENNGDYQPYRDYAVELGIIKEGEFEDLSAEATRQEMAYVLYNSLPSQEIVSKKSVDKIADMDMSYKYYDCALAMAEAGIINLNQHNEYRPESTATRAEAASIIDKLIYPDKRA